MNDYDVPREPGLYWVQWNEGYEPTIARQLVFAAGFTELTLYKYWVRLGTDEDTHDPLRVLDGPIAFEAYRTHKWEDISRSKNDPERAALIAAKVLAELESEVVRLQSEVESLKHDAYRGEPEDVAHLAVVRALLERLVGSTWQTGDLGLPRAVKDYFKAYPDSIYWEGH